MFQTTNELIVSSSYCRPMTGTSSHKATTSFVAMISQAGRFGGRQQSSAQESILLYISSERYKHSTVPNHLEGVLNLILMEAADRIRRTSVLHTSDEIPILLRPLAGRRGPATAAASALGKFHTASCMGAREHAGRTATARRTSPSFPVSRFANLDDGMNRKAPCGKTPAVKVSGTWRSQYERIALARRKAQ